ncbi:MAG: sel1 repeat family protein, partial [Sulfurimicrobium sp.]|nr:sel1 repeat family protein [Sulfurimicrobium sp.]
MNVPAILFSAVLLLSLAGCGEKVPGDKPETGASPVPMGEITTEKELPSVLTEGLTAEEKSELMNKIMPSAQT